MMTRQKKQDDIRMTTIHDGSEVTTRRKRRAQHVVKIVVNNHACRLVVSRADRFIQPIFFVPGMIKSLAAVSLKKKKLK